MFEDPPSHFFLPENPEEPEFADWAETNVTAQLGGSVFLHCPVINSGDRAVSYPSVSILFLTFTNNTLTTPISREKKNPDILQLKMSESLTKIYLNQQ